MCVCLPVCLPICLCLSVCLCVCLSLPQLIERAPDEGSDEPPEAHEDSAKVDENEDNEAKDGSAAPTQNKIMKLKYRRRPPVPVLEKPLKDGVPLDGVYNCFVYNKSTIAERMQQIANGSSIRSAQAAVGSVPGAPAAKGSYTVVSKWARMDCAVNRSIVAKDTLVIVLADTYTKTKTNINYTAITNTSKTL